MTKLMTAILVTAGLSITGTVAAQMGAKASSVAPLSKEAYTQAQKDAGAQYKVDKDACSSFKANARDVCIVEAKGKEDTTKADAKVAFENTPKNREAARVAHAEATYKVSKEKCDDLAGNAKDVCVKEAKAAQVKGKADAKVDRVAADTRIDGAEKRSDARQDAAADKRTADYKVAIEKCDALAGAAKDSCVASAKSQYGKS